MDTTLTLEQIETAITDCPSHRFCACPTQAHSSSDDRLTQ